MDEQDLVFRLRKRAEIRRQITTRKSVQEGKPDRIADLLDEAADEIEKKQDKIEEWKSHAMFFASMLAIAMVQLFLRML
jgi:S-adenosylmethionine synthetase